MADQFSDHIFRPNRRAVIAGVTAMALQAPNRVTGAEAALVLRCKADQLRLREKEPPTAVWSFGDQPLRFKRGDRPEIMVANDLPISVAVNWRGIDGIATSEPLLARSPLAPAASDKFQLPLRHAGTSFCDMALLGDGAAQPSRVLPLIVAEDGPIQIDRDELFLIEGWRVRPDGIAIAPGLEPAGTSPVYTVNGQLSREVKTRGRERLRLRFINGLPRQVIALKIEHHDVTIMALDGQPAEPFLARNGAFALTPGGRADVFIDAVPGSGTSQILLHDGEAARPIGLIAVSEDAPIRTENLAAAAALPSNGLPAHLDLKSALRIDIPFGGDQKDWLQPTGFASTSPPAFRAKAGRIVVLSLINRASVTSVFHLHGHHFRHLDRLDDGWKPFWLDTIAIDAGQTQRIAFAAAYPGRWLIEAAEVNWSAPKLLRWFVVE
jgi:FtsP/CotA-like multicopper oxidase with cupredoxin domain